MKLFLMSLIPRLSFEPSVGWLGIIKIYNCVSILHAHRNRDSLLGELKRLHLCTTSSVDCLQYLSQLDEYK